MRNRLEILRGDSQLDETDDPEVALELIARFERAYGADRYSEYARRFIEYYPDAADRRLRPGHLTGSALVFAPDGRFLLMKHARYGTWQQVGGHADGNTNLLSV